MKTVVVGGNSREVGKTSLAASLIAAMPELGWTAVKLTQFGHGICSRDGTPCDCAVEDPECPFEIAAETGANAGTDSARMLDAGAADAYWIRVGMGQLPAAMPAIREALSGKSYVMIESNSIVEHIPPDLYLSVLNFDTDDCKESAAKLAPKADAFVLSGKEAAGQSWSSFDSGLFDRTPVFEAGPPTWCSHEIIDFVRQRISESPTHGDS